MRLPAWLTAARPFSLLLIAVLPVFLWHFRNQGWPNDDAANYMATAYQEYHEFSKSGFWDGMAALYFIRGWRPVLFPDFAVPFLLAFRGHVVPAASATLLLGYLGLISYAYAIARRYLVPSRAAAAALAVFTLPAFVVFSLVFFTELWWLFTSLAALYHLLAADRFRNRRHAALAGMFLGLSVLIRPAESTVIMMLPVGLLLAGGWRRGAIDRTELVAGLSVLGSIGAALVASAFIPELSRTVLLSGGLAVFGAWLTLLRGRRIAIGGVSMFVGVLAAINLAWWAGFMPALYDWVYITSFGEMARLTGDLNSGGLLATLSRAFSIYAVRQVYLLACVAALGLIAALIARGWRLHVPKRDADNVTVQPSELGVLAAAILFPIATMYAWTGTSDPRRPIVGMAVATLFVAILALRGGPLIRLRMCCVLLVAAINVSELLAAAQIWVTQNPVANAASLPAAKLQEDDNAVLIDELAKFGINRDDHVAVYTLALFQYPARVYEPAALTLVSITKGYPPGLIGYLWNEGRYSVVLASLFDQGFRYLLLDLYDGPGARDVHNPYVEFTASLLDRVHSGADLDRLDRVAIIHLGGRDHLLFRLSGKLATAR